ncbi:MAG: phosphoesterase [Rhodospirillales bacterium]|nr:phosphoesterase [Rhodospirillales bacterium]
MWSPDSNLIRLAGGAAASLLAAAFLVPLSAHANDRKPESDTASPIKHVIIIVGENRTFDHVFGAYQPPHGETVSNLLSKGIINADGTPGPNFALAQQYKANVTGSAKYTISPSSKTLYATLPPPNTGSAPTSASDTNPPPLATLAVAAELEGDALPKTALAFLTTGATGLPNGVIDTRIPNVNNLPNGAFQLSPSLGYDEYANSPVHRFYQMWQQVDCDASHASADNPSGCLLDLFPWVEVSVGAGSNGAPQPAGFNDETTREGATAMGFYNVNIGDVPYFTALANRYAISDNYHQPVMGGTGANSIMIGAADAFYFTDAGGSPASPPTNEIENPDPQSGTNNYYTQDGYSGGSYSNCSDPTAPGVAAVIDYLKSINSHPNPNCAASTYYLLNNYNPGFNGDGTVNQSPFTIPPSPVRTIADSLLAHDISWKYYGEGWNSFVTTPKTSVYCNICNPFLYETAIMTNEAVRTAHLKDTTDLYADISSGDLPAVSFVKPGGLLDGHPASSKFNLFEAFTQKIVESVHRNPTLWADTAIIITVDEGGGYYDSGYIQPVDFFGDGTRIPLIVVSPFSRGGHVEHAYYDHASLVKFINRNWKLSPITGRSRDNLPNPTASPENPYVPVNGPAIGDLFEMFDFDHDKL